MEIAKLVLEYFKIIFSWPVIAFSLVLFFLKLFHDPLLKAISGMKSAKASVGPIAVALEKQQEEIKLIPEFKKVDPTIEHIRNKPEEVIKEYIQLFHSYRYERAFNLIYGTQIGLLEHLSKKPDKRDKYINLFEFYVSYTQKGGSVTYQFASYVGFLIDAFFVKLIPDATGDTMVEITPFGLNFLTYIKGQYEYSYKAKPL